MKKFVLFILAAAMSVAANAQVVTSRTMVKAKSQPTLWYGRIGLSLNNAAGGNDYLANWGDHSKGRESSLGTRAGMSLDFGFQKTIKGSGLYWGMELGIGTRGASMKSTFYNDEAWGDEKEVETDKCNFLSWNIKYSPLQLGYKYSLTDNLKLDAHIGAYASYDFAGKGKATFDNEYDDDVNASLSEIIDDYDFQCFDAGMQLGIGVWWKNFNFDITWQKGFVTAVTLDNYDTDKYDVNVTSSNLMLRIGYAF